MPDKIISMRLPAEVVDRLNDIPGNRSDFIRKAILKALETGIPATEADERQSEVPKRLAGREADKDILLKMFSGKNLTSRAAQEASGFLGLRYPHAEAELLAEGKIAIENGVVVVL